MSLWLWIVQSLLEPMFWGALQWTWSWDSPSESDVLWFCLYSNSPTSVLLWLYETVPHSVLLMICVTGLCALTGMFMIGSCCGLAYRVDFAARSLCSIEMGVPPASYVYHDGMQGSKQASTFMPTSKTNAKSPH